MTTLAKYKRLIPAAAAFVFFLFFVIFPIVNTLSRSIHGMQLEGRFARVRVFLSAERARLLDEARAIGTEENVVAAIRGRDTANLLALLTDEQKKRHVGLVIAADADGIVLVRTDAISRRGDRISETTPWGRAATGGEEATMFGYGQSQPLIMMAAYPLRDGDPGAGSIFVGQALNADYASFLHNQILGREDDVVFYSSRDGFLGSSFTDPETDRLLAAYLSPGTDWNILSGAYDRVSLGGRFYAVQNLPLPTRDGGDAGLIVFSEIDYFPGSAGAAAIFALSFLMVFFALSRLRPRGTGFKKHWMFIGGSTVLVFIIVFFISQMTLKRGIPPISPLPYVLYNSTMTLEPSADVFETLAEQRIKVLVETGGEAVNAAQAVLHYDPNIVNVESIITANSFCSPDLFIDKYIDPLHGEVRIACGLPTPGFSGRQGILAEILVRPLREGAFVLRFGDETQVLANDGLGTDVLRFTTNGSYQATDRSRLAKDSIFRVSVFSPTHPNSEVVYNEREIQFSWPRYEGYGYRYRFDEDSNPDLRTSGITKGTSAIFRPEGDGTYYFHIAAEKGGRVGPTTTYKVSIDTIPPLPPLVRASNTAIKTGEVVRVDISTRKSADLQPVIYLRIDDGLFFPVGPQIFVPFIEPGDHVITARVFDQAGNLSEGYVRVKVVGESLWNRMVGFDFKSLLR